MNDGVTSVSEIELTEPTYEPPRRDRRGRRRQLAIAAVAVLCLAAVAIPVALRANGDPQTRRKTSPAVNRRHAKSARVQVGAALTATVAARNYRIVSQMSETPGASAHTSGGLTFSSEATVNVDPLAMVATADLAGMAITSWTDGTRQWERGGANYGLTSPDGIGPGQPISGFTSLVSGTLGSREGGVAMMGLASPNGHLDLTEKAISAVTEVARATVDGAELREYDVTVDAAELLHQPGMTPEQIKAALDGLELLQQQGYTKTTERLGIDAAGYLRQAHTMYNFSDGGSVVVDTKFFDYGCAGTVVLPTRTPTQPPASTCVSPDPAATTPPG